MKGLGPKLPLRVDIEDGPYRMYKTLIEMVSQNLKILVLTSPGERVMDSNFGVGIQRYLFEQNVQSTWADIDARIRSQTKTYIPAIRINNIKFITTENTRGVNENYLGLRIDFTIVPLKIRSTFEIPRSDGGISIIENPNWGYVTSI